ncbi:unnamed protein product [Owenia fusiformis]|uniref:C3/C5 convertase n=1 Tax=Owenia fusiformis TaxID=6347 RepID=A0A8J1YCM9_OWEFU|nr:unnamed protein product [Owenia fusiformis]
MDRRENVCLFVLGIFALYTPQVTGAKCQKRCTAQSDCEVGFRCTEELCCLLPKLCQVGDPLLGDDAGLVRCDGAPRKCPRGYTCTNVTENAAACCKATCKLGKEVFQVGNSKQTKCLTCECTSKGLKCSARRRDECKNGCVDGSKFRREGSKWTQNDTKSCRCNNKGNIICSVIVGKWSEWSKWTNKCPAQGGGKNIRYRICEDQDGDKVDTMHCDAGKDIDVRPCSSALGGRRRGTVNKNTKSSLIAEYAWVVSLSKNVSYSGEKLGHFCGGTILTAHWIITAAHCPCGIGSPCCDENSEGVLTFNEEKCDTSTWEVTAGEIQLNRPNPEQVRGVMKIVIHHDYVTNLGNDTALIRLDTPFDFSEFKVQPSWIPSSICTGFMSEQCVEHLQLAEHQDCEVIGWGSFTKMRSLKAFISDWDNETYTADTEGIKGSQPCSGDSGGPLMCTPQNEKIKVLIGIMSRLTMNTECGGNNQGFTIHTAVPYYLPWIRDELTGRGGEGWDDTFSKEPWTASLWKSKSYYGEPIGYFCGGVIITETYLLTSSSCLCLLNNYCCDEANQFLHDKCDLDDWWVQIGQCKLEDLTNPFLTRRIRSPVIHEFYTNPETGEPLNDIALVELEDPLDFDDPSVEPVVLPASECSNEAGKKCKEELNEETVSNCHFAGCGGSSQGSGSSDKLKITNATILFADNATIVAQGTTGSSLCQEDAGSPLICNIENQTVAFGVVSQPSEREDCSANGKTAITPIAPHLEWISRKIADDTWFPWGACSVTCEQCPDGKCPVGTRKRSRPCPYPRHGKYRAKGKDLYQRFDINCLIHEEGKCQPKCRDKCPTIQSSSKLRVLGGPPFKEGQEARFQCDPGYALDGPKSIRCKAGGEWNAGLPRCRKLEVTCKKFDVNRGDHITVKGKAPYKPGQKVRFRCDDGFKLQGKRALQCKNDGSWNGKIPICNKKVVADEKTCSEIKVGDQMKFNGQAPYTPGDKVTFTCADDYDLQGVGSLVCGKNGQWNKAPPKCIKRTCEINIRDRDSAHMTVRGKAPFTIGETITFTCDAGYKLEGAASLLCKGSGQWDKETPKCIKQTCPDIDVTGSPALRVRGRSPFTPGENVTFSCGDTYELEGPDTIQCKLSGEWSKDPPKCVELAICPDITIDKPDERLKILGKPPFRVHDKVRVGCIPTQIMRSRKFDVIGSSILACKPGGVWNDTLPSCVFKGKPASGCRRDRNFLPVIDHIDASSSPPICADLMVVLDISCSLRGCTKERLKDAAADVARALLESSRDTTRIGVIAYSNEILEVIPLENNHSEKKILNIIDRLNTTSPKCKTLTHAAFQDIRKQFASVASPIGTKQVVHLYTDGLTFMPKYKQESLDEAKKLKQEGVKMNVIAVPNIHGKNGTTEFEQIPSSQKHLFNITFSDVTQKLYTRLLKDAACS